MKIFLWAEIFHKIYNDDGELEKSRCLVEIPDSYNQVYDIARKHRSKDEKDELVEILDMSVGQIGKKTAFIRDVRTAPEKSVFLAYDWQLYDVFRFCGDRYPWSVLGIDATFNICNYNVTLTTYQHPMLLDIKSGKSPVILGPSLIHSHKTHDSYYTLPSNIMRFCKDLKSIFVIGSDDESALYGPFKECFPSAEHLLCTIHMKDDIKRACKTKQHIL